MEIKVQQVISELNRESVNVAKDVIMKKKVKEMFSDQPLRKYLKSSECNIRKSLGRTKDKLLPSSRM